jgi:hypothetical protein
MMVPSYHNNGAEAEAEIGGRYSLKQKPHACTGPHREDRARDVLNILLVDLLSKLDYARTHVAAKRTFAEHATYPFPPRASLPAEWRRELETLAQELGYPTTNAKEIEGSSRRWFRQLRHPRPIWIRHARPRPGLRGRLFRTGRL